MKRCWFGFALLGLLLIGSLALGAEIDAFQEPVCRNLEQARQAALEGNWADALAQAGSARNRWERGWKWLAAGSDHALMEELDCLYAQLEVAGQRRNGETFASLCAALCQRTEALPEPHRASWWNVL